MKSLLPTLALIVGTAGLQAAEFNLRDYGAKADGAADDTAAFQACFAAASAAGGGTLTIPAGEYFLKGDTPISLSSHLTVSAYGASFHLPETLGDKARVVLFAGTDVTDFRWFGGHFTGHVFDPARPLNQWEPNANTRSLLFTTSPRGNTAGLTFRDLTSMDMAGAVISVQGVEKKGSDREIETRARDVTIENCTLERSGKFMWDYGYLWQITVWPEDYPEVERAMAAKYFRQDLVHGPLRMAADDDRIFFDNARAPLGASGTDSATVCFFGDALPSNLTRGSRYFVVESTPEFIRVAEHTGGPAVRFATAAGPQLKLISNLQEAFNGLYASTGNGPGKGAFDLVGCAHVIVQGCRLSALGDTMHIQKSEGVVFSGNHITGSRMGAFFLAEYCKNAVISGNTIDGTNGSRVMSVEKSCENVTIVGNTFRNGGRGSWINQPRHFVLADNIFINNTTKCEPDPRRGRRSVADGQYEKYSELYFTTYEPGGSYGEVIVRGNVFVSGAEARSAISFAPGGSGLLVTENILRGPVRTIGPVTGCTDVVIRDNLGAEEASPVPATPPARTFHSESLGREVNYSAFLPPGSPPAGGWPLVLLLHGAGRNHRTVIEDDECRAAVTKHHLAIVFADGGASWYLDSPVDPASRYQTILLDLLAQARRELPVSSLPARTGVCGWSMGGYGAMRLAETFPEEIGAVATTIGLLDFPNPALPKEQNYSVSSLFGQNPAVWAKLNCMSNVEALRGKAVLFLTGDHAFDETMNRHFDAQLTAAGIPHDFREVSGAHDFPTVQATLPTMLDFLEAHLQ